MAGQTLQIGELGVRVPLKAQYGYVFAHCVCEIEMIFSYFKTGCFTAISAPSKAPALEMESRESTHKRAAHHVGFARAIIALAKRTKGAASDPDAETDDPAGT